MNAHEAVADASKPSGGHCAPVVPAAVRSLSPQALQKIGSRSMIVIQNRNAFVKFVVKLDRDQ